MGKAYNAVSQFGKAICRGGGKPFEGKHNARRNLGGTTHVIFVQVLFAHVASCDTRSEVAALFVSVGKRIDETSEL